MRTRALAHIPSKENLQQAIAEDLTTHQDSLSVPSPFTGIEDDSGSQGLAGDDSGSLTTNPDAFGTYRVYAQEPITFPSEPGTLNTICDMESTSSYRPAGVILNQGALRTETEIRPYFHPFSNPSAAAMMVGHHSGTSSIFSVHQTNRIAHLLGRLGSDINPMDLNNFDATRESN